MIYPLPNTNIHMHMIVHAHRYRIFIPSGNQTWQWNIPYEGSFIRKNHLFQWSIFQHAMFDETGGYTAIHGSLYPINPLIIAVTGCELEAMAQS